jgi:arabinofuranan 3-O-arabinosyltransferase
VVADGRHSIPTVITVTTASGSRRVVLPHIGTGVGRPQGSVTPVLAQFPALTGANIKITIDATEPVHFLDYVSGDQNTEPVGLAEAGIPGVAALSTPAQIPTRCWSNLLQVDGKPIDIAISGTSSTALSNGGLSITGCGNSADGIRLSAGTHILTTSSYTTAGLNVDSLTLASAAGGAPLPLTSTGLIPVTPPPAAHSPSVKVLSQNRTGMKVSVTGDGTPFWLVLGESQSRGWVATTRSGVDLGSSTLIDGYANGWYVPASAATGKVVVSIEWQPQRVVNAAIVASSAALAASLGLVLLPPGIVAERLSRRRRSSRKRKRRGAGRGASRGTSAAAQAGAASEAGVLTDAEAPQANTAVSTEGLEPRLANPLRSGGRRPTWYWAVGIAVLCGLVAAVAVAPLAGLAVGAVLLLGLLVDRSRVLLVLGALGFISLTGVVMARGQFIHRFVPDINWPAHFPVANSFTWLAICLLAADAIVVAVRLRPSASATRSVVDDGPTGPEVAEGAAAEGAAAEDGGGEGTEESARGAVEESVDESAGVVTGGADAEAADEGSGAEEHADEGSVGDGAAEAEEHAEEQGGAGGAGEENGGSAEHGDGGVL